MPTMSPQRGIAQSIILTQADILQLNTDPKIIVPGEVDYCPAFANAPCIYTYRGTVFENVNNLLAFYLKLSTDEEILISNSLNGTNIIGLAQSTNNARFIAANPYTPKMMDCSNSTIIFKMLGSNPTGGDPTSTLTVNITYDLYQIS